MLDIAAQNLPNLMSMIGMFVQERRHQKGLSHQQFLEWLDTHHFEELKRMIVDTHGLEREIDTLLQAQQSQILSELSVISQSVRKIASRMEILGGVALAVSPRINLSIQALEIIRLLNDAPTCYPFLSIFSASMNANMLTVGTTTYTFDEGVFLREDIGDLLNAGFIMKHKTNDRGEPVFGITRLGADFVKSLPPLAKTES